MIKFESDYSYDEIINRWDEYTSVSRFAGCDDTMDLIFVSKRKANRVRLVRKAKASREPFSSVFHGRIIKKDNGSIIEGYFSKSLSDYIGVLTLNSILFYIRFCIIERGEDLNTINTLIAASLILSISMLINYRSSKRKYADFISRIVGKENTLFISKSELNNNGEEN